MQQQSFISQMKNLNKKLILSGDGRADNPGHSAKYGCFTVVERTCNKVVDYRLACPGAYTTYCNSTICIQSKSVLMLYHIESNEVGGRYYMEKEGLRAESVDVSRRSLPRCAGTSDRQT